VTKHRQDLKGRAFTFAERALPLHPRLSRQGTTYAHMAQQMWEAVSSIGAQLEEGEVANSRRDMAAKHAIALREAREARYWCRLIGSDPAWSTEVRWFIQESEEFVRMLTVSVRKLRSPPE
jgi:four helix bundle protein